MPLSTRAAPRRSYLRFSLRTFCLLILVCSVLLGAFSWRRNRARRQRAAVESLKKMWIHAEYRLPSAPFPPPDPPWIQQRLEPWLGKDFFESVVTIHASSIADTDPQKFYAAIQDLPHVQRISVPGIAVPGTLHHLRQLRNLQSLALFDGAVNEHDLQAIGSLRSLNSLYLGTRFDNGGLRHLQNLQQLTYLGLGPELTDEGLHVVQCPSTLESLVLPNSQITDDGLEVLLQLPKLQFLNLRGTKITSRGLRHLPTCRQLRDLQVQETQIDDEALRYIGQCRELYKLELSKTRVSDAGLVHLQELTSLGSLELEGTLVTGSGLDAIAGRCPVWYLSLGGSPHFALTSKCLKPFERMTKLTQLHFLSDKITPSDLAAVQWPPELSRVDVGVPVVDVAALQPLTRCPQLIQVDIVRDVLPPETLNQLRAILPIVDQINLESITGQPAAER